MMWFISNWKYLLAAMLIATAFEMGHSSGKDTVQKEFDAYKTEQIKAELKATEDNQLLINKLEKQKNDNQFVIDSLQRDIATIRVRVPKAPSCATQANPASGGTDEPAGSGEFPDPIQTAFDDFTKSLADRASEADRIVESCRVLRDWAAGLSQ